MDTIWQMSFNLDRVTTQNYPTNAICLEVAPGWTESGAIFSTSLCHMSAAIIIAFNC